MVESTKEEVFHQNRILRNKNSHKFLNCIYGFASLKAFYIIMHQLTLFSITLSILLYFYFQIANLDIEIIYYFKFKLKYYLCSIKKTEIDKNLLEFSKPWITNFTNSSKQEEKLSHIC